MEESVGWSFPTPPPPPFFKNPDAGEIQYYSLVWILGHAEPQNWFDPSVGRGCIPLCLVKISFFTVTTYSDILFWTFLFKNTKLGRKKNADPCFPIFWVGQNRANKHLLYYLEHFKDFKSVPHVKIATTKFNWYVRFNVSTEQGEWSSCLTDWKKKV